jgi:hypothetical protein
VKAENERGRPPAGQRNVRDSISAVMLVAGQLYIENKSASFTTAPAALIAAVPWDKPSAKLPL